MESWKRKVERIETPWAETVGIESPFNEYPRPQLVRENWENLNGLWDYAVLPKNALTPESWEGKILVPYALETAASGVKRPLLPEERLWYRRSFRIPEGWNESRILLHFEAVDWQCTCIINGREAGRHTGGYVPFSFDITDLLREEENELILSVWDPTDRHWQQRGKQTLKPRGCFYTATSGIWQTVWMEAVPRENHIDRLKLTPCVDSSSLSVEVSAPGECTVRIRASGPEGTVSEIEGLSGRSLELPVPSPRLWSPDDPFLYDLKAELTDGERVIDSADSYFAMRKVSSRTGKSGHTRVFLNDTPVFLHGPLDQGYWPESGMTPPSEEAILFDLEKTKALGFNMTRKHIKVEPRRWYYHADRLGLMVIQDMMSTNNFKAQDIINFLLGIHLKDTTRRFYRNSGRKEEESRKDYEQELKQMMDHLHNHPSIVVWCPFNEAWGQFDAARIGAAVKGNDPTRLVDQASGWHDQWEGDFLSRHNYAARLRKPKKGDGRVYFISEYGGCNLQTPGNMWDENRKFGYRSFKNREALAQAYSRLIREQIIPLIKDGLGAAVYTQISDVEIESNGFYSYDRKIAKFDEAFVRDLNREIYRTFGEEENGAH